MEQEVASSLIVRVVSLAPHRPRQFLVLSCGGTSYTSLEVDENGLFAQQFIFVNVGSNAVSVSLVQKSLFFDRRVATAVVQHERMEAEKVCAEAVSLSGDRVLQLLLLKTTRRADELVTQEHQVDEEDDFVLVPSQLLQKEEPAKPAEVTAVATQETSETLSQFLDKYPLSCTVCGGSEGPGTIWLDCLHVYCKACMSSMATSEATTCPGGACPVFPDWALRRVMSDEALLVLDKKRLMDTMDLVKCASDRVSCPKCSFVFLADREAGGKDASKFRCRECLFVWCVCCGVSPFHDGQTCAENEAYRSANKCRFCQAVCKEESCAECSDKAAVACKKRRSDCGHRCCGTRGESVCFKTCYKCSESEGSEFCAICYCEDLRAQPVVQLECGHAFHYLCLKKQINSGYPRMRVTFGHIRCPLCKSKVECSTHKSIGEAVEKWCRLEKQIEIMAVTRLSAENRFKEVKESGETPESYAMRIYSYYVCGKCSQPYFAGLVVCGEADEGSKRRCPDCTKPAEVKCKHGSEFQQFKCRFCCSVASFKCWSTHSFCTNCHQRQVSGEYLSRQPASFFKVCPGPSECPLGIKHPHCEEVYLGCSMCKSMKGF